MGDGGKVRVIGRSSRLVEVIADEKIVRVGREKEQLTSAQRLQSNLDLVAEVLNSCFWASLASEEGRPVASGVTFAAPADVGFDQLTLEQPEPLTLESLVRLGTVAGTSYRLAVHEHHGTPHIWGFLRGYVAPFLVTVWFDRPSVLRVMVEDGHVLGVLDRGSIFTPQGYAMANRWNVRSQLQNLLGTLRSDLIEVLMFVANEMSRHGNGGALLVVSGDHWKGQVQLRYSLDERSKTLLRRLRRRPIPIPGLDSMSPEERDRVDREGPTRATKQVAKQVAGLTKIDGAAVIGDDLTVFGFGARITSADITHRPVLKRRTIYEEDSTGVEWTDLGGTRHQSAARFVAATKTSAAFVASHDGGLSTLAWKDDPAPGHLEWLCGLEGLIAPQ
jgi:hypothetical protein